MNWKELTEVLPNLDEKDGEEILIHYLCQKDNTIPNMLKIVDERQKLDKELKTELNVNLSFLLLALKLKDQNAIDFRLEEAKKFYTENKEYIRTAGVHIWEDLS